jgi:two-component sensor histidine kinase
MMHEDEQAGQSDRNAFSLLLSEFVERLLALADNPRKASGYIAEELRNLIGARTVAVVSHIGGHGQTGHAVRSVYPERRRQLTKDTAFVRLVESSHGTQTPRLLNLGSPAAESGILRELGVGSALLLPLAYGRQRVGVLIFLDFLEDESLHKAMETLERMSSMLALVLRNADLFGSLEDKVAERTILLERRTQELEALLKEVHHRVKNNLQIVLSLLHLTSSTTKILEARELLEDSQARIFAMSLVHEEIYRTGDFSGIDLAHYAPRIADQLLMSTFPAVERVYHVQSLRLDLEIAIPCGLIISELVTNSIKHAFSGRGTGRLSIETGTQGNESFIRIADDGPGFKDSPADSRKAGIGLEIIDSLVHQIGGKLVQEQGPGASCLLLFKNR